MTRREEGAVVEEVEGSSEPCCPPVTRRKSPMEMDLRVADDGRARREEGEMAARAGKRVSGWPSGSVMEGVSVVVSSVEWGCLWRPFMADGARV